MTDTRTPPPVAAPAGLNPKPRFLRFGVVLLGAAVAVFLTWPLLARALDPAAGAFETLGFLHAHMLAVVTFAAEVATAFLAWRFVTPAFYEAARESLEQKVLDNLTAGIKAAAEASLSPSPDQLAQLRLRLHLAIFQFVVRCVRLVLCLSPFFLFFHFLQAALRLALTLVPASGPST